MSEKPRGIDEEIERALEILDRTLGEGQGDVENEPEIDTALGKLIRLLPEKRPSQDFSNRVMVAVRRAPLPAGRRRLGARPPWFIAGVTAAAAAVAISAALWSTGFAQFLVARTFLAIVQRSVSAIRFVSLMLPAWRWIVITIGAVIEAMASTELLSAVLFMMLLTVLPFMGLRRLVSSSSKESIKW